MSIRILFQQIFYTLVLFLALDIQAYQINTSNFTLAVEDVPADMASDLDANDLYANVEVKTHVDDLGNIVKSTLTLVPIAYGAEHDLDLVIGLGLESVADLISHGELSGEEQSLPYTLYQANDLKNDFFPSCSIKKMINVKSDEDGCFGEEKAVSIIYKDGQGPSFSSFDSNESYAVSLISIKNNTLNNTLGSDSSKWGFQNMMILPSDVEVTASERANFFTEMIGDDTSFIFNGKNVSECKPSSGKVLSAECKMTISEFFRGDSGFKQRQQNSTLPKQQLSYSTRREFRKAKIELTDMEYKDLGKESLRAKERKHLFGTVNNDRSYDLPFSPDDNTPPQISLVTTSSGPEPIATNSKFIIHLNEAVNLSSNWSNFFRIYTVNLSGPPQVIGIGYPNRSDHLSLSKDKKTITFTPHSYGNTSLPLQLPISTTVSLQINSGAFKDLAGNPSSLVDVNIYNFNVSSSNTNFSPTTCSAPAVQNANTPHNQSSTLMKGTTSLVSCQPGYKILGGNRFICSTLGVLTGSPECVVDEYYGEESNLNLNNSCFKTGLNGNLHQVGNKLVQVDTTNYSASASIKGVCINAELDQEKEYESTEVTLNCVDHHLIFDTGTPSSSCTDFSTEEDNLSCSVFGFASGVVSRENISHFSYGEGVDKKNLHFEMKSPPALDTFGYDDLSLLDSNGNDVVKNHDILDNPLAMYYATCKHMNASDPGAGDVCAWEKPGDPSCYGKFNSADWASKIDSPVALGPLGSLDLGYSGTLSMNSLSSFDSISPEDSTITYIVGTSVNDGNGIWDQAVPRRHSHYWNLENSIDDNKVLTVPSNLFSGTYISATNVLNYQMETISNPLNYQSFYKASEKAAFDEYLAKIYEATPSANFSYLQNHTFKRAFNGNRSIPKYDKLPSSPNSDIKKLCNGVGCKNIIVTGDSSKCSSSSIEDSTEIYCFPSSNIRIFKENDSFIYDSNGSIIFTFDGYENITFEDLSLEVYPSPKFVQLFNWVKKVENNNEVFATGDDKNQKAKRILQKFIAPSYEDQDAFYIRPKSSRGDYLVSSESNFVPSMISSGSLSSSGLSYLQAARLGAYLVNGSSRYGARLFSKFFTKSNGMITQVKCDGDSVTTAVDPGVPLTGEYGIKLYGVKYFEVLISACEDAYHSATNQVTKDTYDLDKNNFWYNFAKLLSDTHVLDKELYQIGGIISVVDSNNFTMKNVRIKTIVNEYVADVKAQYADFHGNKFEGISAKELIDYLEFDLLDESIGIANLVYRNTTESSVKDTIESVVFADNGNPLETGNNRHPNNDMGQTLESFSFLGGAINVGNHWNGGTTKNEFPTRENAFDFPFMGNPCVNMVLDVKSSTFCDKQWDDLWVEKDAQGNKVELSLFQKYSPFFQPNTKFPEADNEKGDVIDGASYNNRSSCLYLAADPDDPICDLGSSCSSTGYSCNNVVDDTDTVHGYCLKTCSNQSDCASNEQCMVGYGATKFCKPNLCDNQFVSIVSNSISDGTRPNSMAYMDDDFSSSDFNRNINLDAIAVKSTNALVFNNVVQDYGYDTLYDLNQRGENVEDGIIPKTMKVKRNLFKNGNTKNTGASWPVHKIIYSNNLYYNVTIGGYWVLYTPYWMHNSFILPGEVYDSTSGFNGDGALKGRYVMKESSPTETPEWHGPFGHRITFMNNFVISGKTDTGISSFGSGKAFNLGLNLRFKGNLYFGDFSSYVLRKNKTLNVGTHYGGDDDVPAHCYGTFMFTDFQLFNNDTGTYTYGVDSCIRTGMDYFDQVDLGFTYSRDLDADDNKIMDLFDGSSLFEISNTDDPAQSPFKTYVYDDLTAPTLKFSNFNVQPNVVSNVDQGIYKTLTVNNVNLELSDFNDRFDLLEACEANADNDTSHSYRCVAGDLTSRFYSVGDFGSGTQFSDYFGSGQSTTSPLESNDSDTGGVAGDFVKIQSTQKFIDLFDPNVSFSNSNNQTIDYCDSKSSEMKTAIESSRMSSFNVGKKVHRFARDFSGRYRFVKTTPGAFEVPASGISCP